jgi:hypothetical protein
MIKTPKEKAKELVLQFYEVVKNKYPSTNGIPLAKQCAIIAVDEIIDALDKSLIDSDIEWWKQVKQEIEKL